MYCQNCGKELSDNVIFCPYCGAKADNNSDDVVVEEYKKTTNTSFVENIPPKKSKKKSGKVLLIIFIAVFLFLLFISFFIMIASIGNDTIQQLENADFNNEENSTFAETSALVTEEKFSDEYIISFFEECLYQSEVNEKKFRKNVTEERFYKIWCINLTSEIKEHYEFEKSTYTFVENYLNTYKKIWPDTTKLDSLYDSLAKIAEYLEKKDAIIESLEYDPYATAVMELDFYVIKRLDTRYEDNFLGELQSIFNTVTADNSSNWLASNVDYVFGEPFAGDDDYVIYSTTLNPFSEAGAYTINCVNTGKTMEIIDGRGFVKDVPVYRLIQSDGKYTEYDYFNLITCFDKELDKICKYAYLEWKKTENNNKNITIENFAACDLVNMTFQELEAFFGCEAEFIEGDGGCGTYVFANCPDMYFLFEIEDWINMYVDPQKTVVYIYVVGDTRIDSILTANMSYSEIQTAVREKQYSVREESGVDEFTESEYFYVRVEKYPYVISYNWNSYLAGNNPADEVVICGISSEL